MPESKGRKKDGYTPPPERRVQRVDAPNPPWFMPVMLGLMVVGLLWVVVYYISGQHQWPVPALGRWNLGVGFTLMISGFLMTTRWR